MPKVVISGMLGEREYGVLLTDRRMIFVLERTSRVGIAAGLGGAVGAVLASEMATKREFVYADADPDALAKLDGTIVVPDLSVRGVRVRRSFNGVSYAMHIEYASGDGKVKKLNCMLSAPDELMNQRKSDGAKFKVILYEYAKKAQEAFKLALPVGAREESEWLK